MSELQAHVAQIEPSVLNSSLMLLDPNLGASSTLETVCEARLAMLATAPLTAKKKAIETLYGVDLNEAKVQQARARLALVCSRYGLARTVTDPIFASNLIAGNYLTRHQSILPCPADCSLHPNFSLPPRFDLAVGALTEHISAHLEALADHSTAAMVALPDRWRLEPAYEESRASFARRVAFVQQIPWSEFKTDLRYSWIKFDFAKASEDFWLSGKRQTVRDRHVLTNGVVGKAQRSWPSTLSSLQSPDLYPLHLGWKTTLRRDSKRISMLTSLHHEEHGQGLARDHLTVYFPTRRARSAFVQYSSTKLAAYLQSIVGTGTLSRSTPLPPLDRSGRFHYDNDEFLYRQLNLSGKEISEVESYKLVISPKVQTYYEDNNVSYREDAFTSRARKRCGECGQLRHDANCIYAVKIDESHPALFSPAQLGGSV